MRKEGEIIGRNLPKKPVWQNLQTVVGLVNKLKNASRRSSELKPSKPFHQVIRPEKSSKRNKTTSSYSVYLLYRDSIGIQFIHYSPGLPATLLNSDMLHWHVGCPMNCNLLNEVTSLLPKLS